MSARHRNALDQCHHAWTLLKLPHLQEELDATANELANRQDESETSRKSLVELSRDFKKNTPEDVRRSVAPLLKSFQSEVDSLSKRSKAAEAAFLNVYKRVIDVPDPVPALETAQNVQKRAEKAHDLEVENEQLRVTLHQYNSEFADCKNQEVTIKQLRERIRALEDSVDAESTKRSAEREKDLQRQAADRERQLQEAQLDLVRRLGEAELRCASLQRALSAAGGELNEARAKHDEALQAKQQEMEMLMQDAENANERALNAERLVERLRSQLEEAARNLERQGGPLATEQAMEALSRSALQLELNAKEKEVAHLVADVKRLHATLAKLKETSGSHMTQMEDELRRKDDALAKLDDRLSSQADYDELKHELSIMKAMEFAGQESPASQRLEGLLLTKNRALQSENTQLRLSTTSLQDQLTAVQADCDRQRTLIDEQTALVHQLEKDLLTVGLNSSAFRGRAEGQDDEDAIQAVLKEGEQGASLLTIVSSQRERFRARNQELEAVSTPAGGDGALSQDNLVCRQQMQTIQNEADKLRSDNVKLYEKIRFLQSYPTGAKTSTSDDAVHRYSAAYEEELNPFTSFSRKERQRRYMDLKLHERMTLGFGRFILSSKTARTFFVIYTLLLHLLVFLALYRVVWTEAGKRDIAVECASKFREHMMNVHHDHQFHVG